MPRIEPLLPLSAGRWAATATLLPDGRVLVAGGYDYAASDTLRGVDLIDTTRGRVTPAAALWHDRNFATAVLLPDASVLVFGGFSEHCATLDQAERYDPRRDRWTPTRGYMNDRRELFTATHLPDGKVLLVGGLSLRKRGTLATAELYDPKTETFTPTTGPLTQDRFGHAAARLPDGRVLIVGGKSWKIGEPDKPLAAAELYDPRTGRFMPTEGPLRIARDRPTATVLLDNRVLIAGGSNADGTPTPCEIFDPATSRFTSASPLIEGRMAHDACLLGNGTVLVAGGWSGTRKATTPTLERYDPRTGGWAMLPTSLPFAAHDLCLIALPDDKRVLAVGGKVTDGNENTATSVRVAVVLTID